MASRPTPSLLRAFSVALRQAGVHPTRYLLVVRIQTQDLWVFERRQCTDRPQQHRRFQRYAPAAPPYRISSSRVGTGQLRDSHRTPLGLHRIARKVGGGWPIGTVFVGRKPVGYTWQGRSDAAIVHRILWLEGLEPGFNRGGEVDTFARYIYLHGMADEPGLGQPASRGCIHLAAADLLPLYDRLPEGTLVWIAER